MGNASVDVYVPVAVAHDVVLIDGFNGRSHGPVDQEDGSVATTKASHFHQSGKSLLET